MILLTPNSNHIIPHQILITSLIFPKIKANCLPWLTRLYMINLYPCSPYLSDFYYFPAYSILSHTGLLAVCQLTKHASGLCPSESLNLECSLVADSLISLESFLGCQFLNGAYLDNSILNGNELIPSTSDFLHLPRSIFFHITSSLLTCCMFY